MKIKLVLYKINVVEAEMTPYPKHEADLINTTNMSMLDELSATFAYVSNYHFLQFEQVLAKFKTLPMDAIKSNNPKLFDKSAQEVVSEMALKHKDNMLTAKYTSVGETVRLSILLFLKLNTPKHLDEMSSKLLTACKADRKANLCWVVDDILEVAHGYDKKNNGRKVFKAQARKRRIKDRCDKTIPGLNRMRDFELNQKMVLGGC